MTENNNPIFTFLAADVYYLHDIGKKYFYCAKKLFEENNPQESLQPFCLLSTTAAELFLKVIIISNSIDYNEEVEYLGWGGSIGPYNTFQKTEGIMETIAQQIMDKI